MNPLNRGRYGLRQRCQSLLQATVIVAALTSNPAFSAGKDGGGGGDSCEARFKVIVQDIAKWIQGGGPKALDFSLGTNKDLTAPEYSRRMMTEIGAKVKCVGPGDADYPVTVNGTPKECRSFVRIDGIKQVICDRRKFYEGLFDPDNNPAQYPLKLAVVPLQNKCNLFVEGNYIQGQRGADYYTAGLPP